MSKSETIIFNGVKFRRYPDAERRTERVYYVPSGNLRKQGTGRLHEEIWKDAHGDIPKGFVVHHIDHNPLNNELSNLKALPRSSHQSQHLKEKWEDPEFREKQVERIRRETPNRIAKLKEWKQTPEGKAQTKKYTANLLTRIEFDCIVCGTHAVSKSKNGGKFCSVKCGSRWHARAWRKNKPGYYSKANKEDRKERGRI